MVFLDLAMTNRTAGLRPDRQWPHPDPEMPLDADATRVAGSVHHELHSPRFGRVLRRIEFHVWSPERLGTLLSPLVPRQPFCVSALAVFYSLASPRYIAFIKAPADARLRKVTFGHFGQPNNCVGANSWCTRTDFEYNGVPQASSNITVPNPKVTPLSPLFSFLFLFTPPPSFP